jgi:hypothetical protein
MLCVVAVMVMDMEVVTHLERSFLWTLCRSHHTAALRTLGQKMECGGEN